MDIRYSANQKDFKSYTTQEIRDEFLIEKLFLPDEMVAVYSHVDRMVTMGCMPVNSTVSIDKGIDVLKAFGAKFLLERREIGIFNIGDTGEITVDGKIFPMGHKDCLYIAMGSKDVCFKSADPDSPARFYMVCAPTHKTCETKLITVENAAKRPLGTVETANKRVIYQFIHPDVLESCQLCMGLTELDEGSVWNTMPAHTHERRMEVYFYFKIPEDQVVFHLMGESSETRHIVLRSEQAVISPSWSIHAGCGTSRYSFIWAMGGENKEFDDMDGIATSELR